MKIKKIPSFRGIHVVLVEKPVARVGPFIKIAIYVVLVGEPVATVRPLITAVVNKKYPRLRLRISSIHKRRTIIV